MTAAVIVWSQNKVHPPVLLTARMVLSTHPHPREEPNRTSAADGDSKPGRTLDAEERASEGTGEGAGGLGGAGGSSGDDRA